MPDVAGNLRQLEATPRPEVPGAAAGRGRPQRGAAPRGLGAVQPDAAPPRRDRRRARSPHPAGELDGPGPAAGAQPGGGPVGAARCDGGGMTGIPGTRAVVRIPGTVVRCPRASCCTCRATAMSGGNTRRRRAWLAATSQRGRGASLRPPFPRSAAPRPSTGGAAAGPRPASRGANCRSPLRHGRRSRGAHREGDTIGQGDSSVVVPHPVQRAVDAGGMDGSAPAPFAQSRPPPPPYHSENLTPRAPRPLRTPRALVRARNPKRRGRRSITPRENPQCRRLHCAALSPDPPSCAAARPPSKRRAPPQSPPRSSR